MPAPDTPRAELVRAAVRLMATIVGLCGDPVEIEVRCNGTRTVVVVSAEEQAEILGPPVRPELTTLEGELLSVLTDRESKPAAIASRAGKKLNSHVYDALRSLATKGYARRGERGGYLAI